MWTSGVVVLALLAALLTSGAAAEDKESGVFQQLPAWTEKARREMTPRARSARLERRTHLSEDEREIMTKQIMQAISGMLWVWGVKVHSGSLTGERRSYGCFCVVHVGMVCSQR